MKIVLDLQGAQSHSRHRGIGRYTLSMARAFAEAATQHELCLALNGLHAESVLALTEHFADLIPRERIYVSELPSGIAGCHGGDPWRSRLAEAAYAEFLAARKADLVWHSSLFEGWGDDSVIARGGEVGAAQQVATLYDLIPLLHPHRHLHDPAYRAWYYRRLGLLKRCDLLLAISESSRREAIEHLGFRADDIAVVHGAADPVFRHVPLEEASWLQRPGHERLKHGYVLYAGGYDAHKNVDALITAYADLPAPLRERHPLVLAGRCDPARQDPLLKHARRSGLAAAQLVFTGSVSDEELAGLYSHCSLFVAPSLHEGLGLPPLEAMACGAAVIGSDSSSLPEVIGCPDALFNPRSPSSIAAKLHEVLIEPDLLQRLRVHAPVQTAKFSWQRSARSALAAIERHVSAKSGLVRPLRPRLIYVSPLPPVRSGIADYSARLLRDLSVHYDIDLVVDQPEVIDPWLQANFPVRSLEWFNQHASACERILYHFGNSPYHAHMFGMLQERPGVVMLHDSWLGAGRHWMMQEVGDEHGLRQLLYACHGYAALIHDQRHGRASTLDAWPVNLDVLEAACGVIVHSDYAVAQARRLYGAAADKLSTVPFPKARTLGDRRRARRALGFGDTDFLVCSFGMIAPTKLNQRLLEAWLASPLADDPRCHLCFVGENHGGAYGQALRATIDADPRGSRIRITGFASADTYVAYLAASDLAVQLRTDSRGETSAAIFDVLAEGLPLIANAHGSAAELPRDVALLVPDRFEDAELVEALRRLWSDADARAGLAESAARWIEREHHPADAARRYRDAIEQSLASSRALEQRLLREMAWSAAGAVPDRDRLAEAKRLFAANRPRLGHPRIYVDVTAIERSGLHTGIERVVRGVLLELLRLEQQPWRIEPVKLVNGAYRHATPYALQLLALPPLELDEAEVHPRAGDVLLGLDWVADALPANQGLLDAWRARGVRMFFVVYDLLPVRHPTWFPPGIAAMHAAWLRCIGRHADGLLCISKSVADDVRDWFERHSPERRRRLPLGYFYLGHDPASTRPSAGLPVDAEDVLGALRQRPAYLMVGTIEPRKGHAFVLDAFERLWAEQVDACLLVVGRQGWMSEALAARMRGHAQAGVRLIWLEQASDEYLEKLYGAVRALIAASEGEGFGLPLVEAASRGLPVLARDIPVFREVSSGFARYFDGGSVDSLSALLRQHLQEERVPDQVGPPAAVDAMLSWQATTAVLRAMLSDPAHDHWLRPWQPTEFVPERE